MNNKPYTLKIIYAAIMFFFTSVGFSAANFNIAPKGALPTTITAGQTVSAYYTVTNMTHTTRSGYVIRGLPATVTQNTTAPNCGNPITLQSRGSCQLQLDITGPVASNFALCKGSSCTTASTPLNVSSGTATMPSSIYVINAGGAPAVSVCALDQTTGKILPCQDADFTGGSAPLQGIVVNTAGTVAYISNGGSSPNTYQCQIDPTTHTFSSCSVTTVTTPSGYTPQIGMLGINYSNTFVYLPDDNGSTGRILVCPIVNGVISGTCTNTNATSITTNTASVIVNKADTRAYIGNGNAVDICTVSNGNTFSGCNNINQYSLASSGPGPAPLPASFTNIGGVALNKTEDILYIVDYGATPPKVIGCPVPGFAVTNFTNCFIANNTITPNFNIVLNATNTVAYLTDNGTNLYSCQMLSNGTFPNCAPATTMPGATAGMALLY